MTVAEKAKAGSQRIDHFFSMPAARADRWRELNALAAAWADGSGSRASVEAALDALGAIEEFHAFPGSQLMGKLRERLEAGAAETFADLARQISTAIVTRSYKQDTNEWQADGANSSPNFIAATLGESSDDRPYFEMLVVTPNRSRAGHIISEFRRLRRNEDEFIYEAVPVASFEDALSAALINPAIAAVTIYEGFSQASHHDAPILRRFLDATGFASVS